MYNNNSSGRDVAGFNMPRARINKSVNGAMRDIPSEELTNKNTPRRLCNGTLASGDEVRGFDNVDRGGIEHPHSGHEHFATAMERILGESEHGCQRSFRQGCAAPERACGNVGARMEAVGDGDGCACQNSCGIACTGWGLNNHPVAMVYSPCQPWNNVYKPEIALERGTIFKDLDLPFEAANKRGGLCH